MLQLT